MCSTHRSRLYYKYVRASDRTLGKPIRRKSVDDGVGTVENVEFFFFCSIITTIVKRARVFRTVPKNQRTVLTSDSMKEQKKKKSRHVSLKTEGGGNNCIQHIPLKSVKKMIHTYSMTNSIVHVCHIEQSAAPRKHYENSDDRRRLSDLPPEQR
jgi:hypothetical protein